MTARASVNRCQTKLAELRGSNLEHRKWQVRLRSLRSLCRLEVDALLDFSGRVTILLEDESWQVRQAALDVLAKLQPLAISTQSVLTKLTDSHELVRRAALQALSCLHPEGFDACAGAVVHCLYDDNLQVRLETLKLLHKLKHTMRVEFIQDIAGRLVDEDGQMRRDVTLMLSNLVCTELRLLAGTGSINTVQSDTPRELNESSDLRKQADMSLGEGRGQESNDQKPESETVSVVRTSPHHISTEGLLESERSNHSDASSSLGAEFCLVGASQSCTLGHAECSQHATQRPTAVVMDMLRRDVVRLLCKIFMDGQRVFQSELTDYVSIDMDLLEGEFASVADRAFSNTLLHQASEHNCLEAVDYLVTKCFSMLHAKNTTSDTPLHLAAQCGHLDVCRKLVGSGALTKTNNKRKLTPADLAEENSHTAVVSFLESRQNLTTVRGGTGDALVEAVADERPIVKVEWYKIYCPGLAGRVGAFHSLLAITVRGTQDAGHSYVIEKAAVARGVGHEDGQQALNGVHVSHWLDVAPNVEHEPILSLNLPDIENNTGSELFCMRVLKDIAVGLGPYNVATCNCHHAALAVYNACAKSKSRVPRIPNFGLVLGARLLQGVGVDVAGSESAASRSACAHSESAATSKSARTRALSAGDGNSDVSKGRRGSLRDSTRCWANLRPKSVTTRTTICT